MTVKVEQPAQMMAPNGESLTVPMSVFRALKDFSEGHKTGSVTVEMRDGGVAGVKVMFVCR